MGELLPLAMGICVGYAAALRPQQHPKRLWLLLLCLPLGALASAVNGELASGLWPAFISFDALIVWLGAALVPASVVVRTQLAGPHRVTRAG